MYARLAENRHEPTALHAEVAAEFKGELSGVMLLYLTDQFAGEGAEPRNDLLKTIRAGRNVRFSGVKRGVDKIDFQVDEFTSRHHWHQTCAGRILGQRSFINQDGSQITTLSYSQPLGNDAPFIPANGYPVRRLLPATVANGVDMG